MRVGSCYWISGWASDISIWEDEIYERFPNFSHCFTDYGDLIAGDDPDDFWDKNPRVAEDGIVIGWSMGSLALLRNLHKKPKEQKWILICPIADFCTEGCWSRAAVRATRQGILENTEQTLVSFAALMGAQKEEQKKWVENAMRYSTKQLVKGLDYLVQKKMDFSDFKDAEQLELIFGEQDKVVSPAQKELFTSLNKKELRIEIHENLGHWLPDYFVTVQNHTYFFKTSLLDTK